MLLMDVLCIVPGLIGFGIVVLIVMLCTGGDWPKGFDIGVHVVSVRVDVDLLLFMALFDEFCCEWV